MDSSSPASSATGSGSGAERVTARAPSGRGAGRAVAVSTLALAIFFLPALGPGTAFIARDNGRMHAPVKRFIAEELRQGRLPEWNPYMGLGSPLVAGAIDAVLHPFNLLLVALPFDPAFKLWTLLSYLAAALGAYAWGRALGMATGSAIAAGLLFALSGPLVSSSDNATYLTTYAALPWLLAAVHRFVATGGPAALALVGLASFACAAGGDPQAWGLAVIVTPVYALTVAGTGARRADLVRGVFASATAVAAAGAVVLPIVLWMSESSRAAGIDPREVARWNLHPLRLLELVIPSLFRGDPTEPVSAVFQAWIGGAADPHPWFLSIYLGAGAVVLAATAAVERRTARWLLVLTAVFAWAALGPHAGFAQMAQHVPVLGSFRFSEKLAIWPALFSSGCAGLGIDTVVRRGTAPARRLAWIAGASAAVALVLSAVTGAGGMPLRGAQATALEANLVAGARHAGLITLLLAVVGWALSRGALGRRGGLVLGAVVVLDVLGGNAGAYVLGRPFPSAPTPLAAGLPSGELVRVTTPFSAREDRWLERGRLESTWEWERRTLAPAWNVAFRVGIIRSYVGLADARLARFQVASQDGNRWTSGGLFDVGYMIVPARADLASRAGLEGPHEVVAWDPELPAFAVTMPHRPRAYVADEVRAVTAEEAFAFALAGGDAASRGAVVEASVLSPPAGSHGRASVRRDEPARVELAVWTDAPALVVLNDAWSPGWHAEVDGEPVPIVRTNYLVRGVAVPSGAHSLRFTYRTPGLVAGALATAACGVALLAWALALRRRQSATRYAAAASRVRSESRTDTSFETPGSSIVTP
jgi:hypothetical protein